MKTIRSKQFIRFLTLVSAVITVMLAVFTEAYSQRTTQERHELNVRALEDGANTPKDSKTVLAEVNEDFNRLRVISEQFKLATAASEPINYKATSDYAVEMKKRGTRLRINLAGLPKTKKDEKRPKEIVPQDEAQMRSLLSSVNVLMTDFLTNPVFSDMGTLDNQLALKAHRDLDALIELSGVVRKSADTLAKTTHR